MRLSRCGGAKQYFNEVTMDKESPVESVVKVGLTAVAIWFALPAIALAAILFAVFLSLQAGIEVIKMVPIWIWVVTGALYVSIAYLAFRQREILVAAPRAIGKAAIGMALVLASGGIVLSLSGDLPNSSIPSLVEPCTIVETYQNSPTAAEVHSARSENTFENARADLVELFPMVIGLIFVLMALLTFFNVIEQGKKKLSRK